LPILKLDETENRRKKKKKNHTNDLEQLQRVQQSSRTTSFYVKIICSFKVFMLFLRLGEIEAPWRPGSFIHSYCQTQEYLHALPLYSNTTCPKQPLDTSEYHTFF